MIWTLLLACAPAPDPTPPAAPPPEAAAPAAPAVQVHLTFDDAPWQMERGQAHALPVRDVQRWNARLLEHLRAADVKASAFATCERMRPGDGTVEAWAAAGHTVGNHSGGHLPAKTVGAEAFVADVAACQATLTQRLGGPPRWFRYPYLGYGADAEAQEAIRQGLRRVGLSNAPITAMTTEWALAHAYREALAAGDRARADAIVPVWVDHLEQAVDAGVALSVAAEGAATPQTLLLHVNELSAHHLDRLLERFRERGFELVDLPTAMAHPAMQRPVVQAVDHAMPWVARTHAEAHAETQWFFEEEERLVKAWSDGAAPSDWHRGVPAVARDGAELSAWLRQAGFLGELRSGTWPRTGKGLAPPADPGPGLRVAKAIDATTNTAGFHHAYELRCHPDRAAVEALAAWVAAPDGLDRPSVVVPLFDESCVASVFTADHRFLLDTIGPLAGVGEG